MADITSRDIVDQIQQLNFNPAEIMRIILHGIQQTTEGNVTLFSANPPIVSAIEAGITTSTAVLQEIRSITRALNSPTVDNWEDLYLHLQDEDLKELQAQPGQCVLNLILSVDEVKQKAVAIDENGDIRQLVFPKHTQITVGDYTLMLKFPVVIRVNKHGNISVKYDLSGEALLGNVNSALINMTFNRYNNIDAIVIPVEAVQVEMSSQTVTVTQSSGFKKNIKIPNNLFFIKAYSRTNNGAWFEIDVTRRLRALNKNRAALQYIEGNGQVTVQVPSYYLINRLIGTEIRLDIFTTKGAITHPLTNYNESAYSLSFKDYDNKNNQYSGVLGGFSILRVWSSDIIQGGRDRLDFDTAKNRVVNRSTISEGVPITELEIDNALRDLGMSSTKVLDLVGETRLYAASRLLPAPSTNLTVTGIGCNVQTQQTTIKELAALATARDNGNRVTVLPSTLYNMVNGTLQVVSDNMVQTMIDPTITSPETTSAWANSNKFVYSPYFYVHDTSNNEYDLRVYRLDSPDVLGKYTVNENPSMLLDASVYNYQISLNEDYSGYTLLLGIAVGDNFKEIPLSSISLQLSYMDESGENRYYVNGSLLTPIDQTTGRPLNDQYIYKFDFNTDWDIDASHHLILSDSLIPLPLESSLDVFIIVKGYRPSGFTNSTMDRLINVFSLDNYDGQTPQSALIQERLSVRFGAHMSNLWHRARTTIDSADYKVYEENIPDRYSENIYKLKKDSTLIEFEYNDTTKRLEPIVLFRQGDVKMVDGVIQYKHLIGDKVIENGEPVYKEGLRGLKRQFDLVVMDGLYYLTTHEATIQYVRDVLDTIDAWVFGILKDKVQPELLQETQVLYHPKSTVGLISVYVENGVKTLVQSDQNLNLRLFVGDMVYNNLDLRRSIETTCKQVIQNILQSRSTISVDNLTNGVSDVLGENVMGVEIKGFMGDLYNTITVVDALTTPSIGKRLAVNSKLELVVEDNVEIEFVWHSRRDA